MGRRSMSRAVEGSGPVPRLLVALVVLSLGLGLVLTSPRQAEAAVISPFTSLFKAQTNGEITITGNTLMTCGTQTGCSAAQTSPSATAGNNDFPLQPLDADNDPVSTRSSSGANVTIPAGSQVLKAVLFWGGATVAGNGGVDASAPSGPIKFKVPGGAYRTVNADRTSTQPSYAKDYSSYADVTALVQAGGAGTYWGADSPFATGVDRAAGWSLVVAYSNPSLPLRDLNIFGGYARVSVNETVTTSVSGFLTPAAGPVNAKIGSVTYEGDINLSGDYMTVGDTRLGDALSPSANFFSSRVSAGGANRTDRTPNWVNTMGLDAKVVDAPNVLPNGATSADITFATQGDAYFPAALTTQIDLYAPTIQGTKSVTNLNGNSPAQVGDVLEYTLAFSNTGEDPATGVRMSDAIPAGTSYLPGSLRILSVAKTDAAGDDQAEVANGQVVARLGTGATATAGGTLAKGASSTVRFRVTVTAAAAGGSVANTAKLDYTAQTLNKPYTYTTNSVDTPVAALADVSVVKTAPATIIAGQPISWRLAVSNAGPSPATNVVVTDTLPPGVTVTGTTPAGTCTQSGQTVRCTLPSLANGATSTITINATLDPASTATSLPNTATVSSDTSDQNLGNNTSASATTITRAADIALSKSVNSGTVVPGNPVTWTLRGTNNGPSLATGAVITDTLPEGLTFVGTPTTPAGTCTVLGRQVQCQVGDLAPGAVVTVVAQTRLDAAWTGTAPLQNNGAIQSGTPDANAANNTASASVTPAPGQADLRTTKTTITAPVRAGLDVAYQVSVSNAGPSRAYGVTVTDTLPAGVTPTAATSAGGACTISGQQISCPVGELAVGGTATVTVRGDVAPSVTGSITNTATASATTADPDSSNNTARVTDQVTTSADLSLTKVASPSPVTAGDTVTYTMTVRNGGTADARGVQVIDPVPSPLQLLSASSSQGTCSTSGAEASCALGTVGVGASATVTVTARVPADTEPAGLQNTARVTSTTTDPEPANNTASYTLPTASSADVAIEKTGPAEVDAGGQVTWNLTVRNNGPSTAQGVTVIDNLPAEVRSVTATTPGGTCSVASGRATCTLGSVAVGASVQIQVRGTVDPGTTAAVITNRAQVSSTTPDATTSNNQASAVSDVDRVADLKVTKTGPAEIVAGQDGTWTVRVSNAGPSVASAVSLRDLLPDNVSFVRATGSQCTAERYAVSCAVGDLAPGETREITVTGHLAPFAAPDQQLTNRAEVSSRTADPNSADNAAEATSTSRSQADLAISKAVLPDPMVSGAQATYQIVVENNGPSSALNVRIADTLPEGLDVIGVQGPGECSTVGREVTCLLPSLPPSGNGKVTIDVNVRVTGNGPIPNTARTSSDTSDPDPANNTTTINTPVVQAADLTVTKTADRDTIRAGEAVTWTLTAVNAGPSGANDAVLTDTLPEGVQVLSTSPGCTVDTAARTVTCPVGALPSGASASRTITVLVPAASTATSVTNQADVSSATPDPVPTNNRVTDTVTVERYSDLSVTKQASPQVAVAGETVTWSIVVNNSGPSAATGVRVSDTLADGLRPISATGPSGQPCTITGQQVSCDLGTRPVGQSVVTIVTQVAGDFAADTVRNTATVTADSPHNPDPITGSAEVDVARRADLAITKTGPAQAVPGQRISYTLVATNNGPSAAPVGRVSDVLSTQLIDVTASSSIGSCTITPASNPETADIPNGGLVLCTSDNFGVGQTMTVTISATIRPDASGTLTNTGNAGSTILDPVAENNASTVDTTLTPSADVSVTKAVAGPVVPGQPVRWQVTVANNGPSDAVGVQVTDRVNPAVSSVRANGPGGPCTVTGQDVACAIDRIAPGANVVIEITGDLAAGFTGPLENAATAVVPNDPNPGNNTGSVSTPSAPSSDVAVTKAVIGPVVPGQPVRWQVTVANDGPSDATAVDVTDRIPAAVGAVTATRSDGGACTVTGQDVACRIDRIAPGADVVIEITGDLAAGFTGPLENAATAAVPNDPNPGNNTGSVSTPSAPSSDVAVTKTVVGPVVPGQPVRWQVTVANSGPSDATAVQVTDRVNPAVSSVRATRPGGTCAVTGQDVACVIDRIAPGASVVIDVSGDLATDFTGPLENAATATVPNDPNPGNNTASTSDPAAPAPDVSVTKRVTGPVVPGRSVTWQITVANNGPSDATAVDVADRIPAAVGAVTATRNDGGTCTVTGQEVACRIDRIVPGASVVIEVGGDLAASFTGTLDNVATATVPNDPNLGNNTGIANDPAVPASDVAVTKTVIGAVVPGQPVRWQVTVANNGPSDAVEVNLTDSVPAAVSGLRATRTDGGTCAVAGQDVTCAIERIASGAEVVIDLTGNLAAGFTGNLANSATATLPNDPNTANNTGTSDTSAAPSSDVAVTKTVVGPVVPGQPVHWQVTVANNGPSDAVGVQLRDTVAGAVSSVRATRTDGGSCSVTGQDVACGIDRIAPRASVVIDVTGDLATDFTGTLANAATAAVPNDPNPDNDTGSVSTPAAPAADVAVTKKIVGPVVPGQPVRWQVTVTNNGPSDATGARVTDKVDPAVTGVQATRPGGVCTVEGQDVTCPIERVIPGAELVIDITGTLAPGFTGSLENAATVIAPNDPNTDNNTATTKDPATPSADVRVTKAVDGPVVPGQPVRWRITVANIGPSDAAGVSVTDSVDPAVTAVQATRTDGGTCAVAGQDVSCGIDRIAPGAEVVVDVTGNLAAGFTGQLQNAATASVPGDPDPQNNTGSTSDPAAPSSDVAVTKTAVGPVVPGQPVHWQVTVINNGPSDAVGVQLRDTVAGAVSSVRATRTDGGSCTVTGQDVACGIDRIAPGASVVIDVTGDLATDFTGTLENTATAAVPNDPNPDNNTGSVSTPAAPAADVAVTKKIVGPVVPGQPVRWQVTVTNTGPADATGVEVTDAVDPAVTGVQATRPGGTCTVTGQDVACRIDRIAPGTSVVIEVTGNLATDFTGTLENAATAALPNDPEPENNTGSSSDPAVPSADVSVRKVQLGDAVPGGPVRWRVTVANAGPSDARTITVSDAVDPAVTGLQVSRTDGGTCAVSGQQITCGIDRLAPNASVELDITGTLAAGFTGALANAATATSVTDDPDPGNNTGSVGGDSQPQADVSVTKKASTASAHPGDTITWTLEVGNAGPSTARNAVVTDTLPAGVSIVGAPTAPAGTQCVVDGRTLRCTIAELAVRGTVRLQLATRVDADAAQRVTNGVSVTLPGAVDPKPADNTDQATIEITPGPTPPIPPTPGPTPPAPTPPGPNPPGPNPPGPEQPPTRPGPPLGDTGAAFGPWGLVGGLLMLGTGLALVVRRRRH